MSKTVPAKKSYIGFRTDNEVKEKLEEHATRLRRTLSFLVDDICQEWLEHNPLARPRAAAPSPHRINR